MACEDLTRVASSSAGTGSVAAAFSGLSTKFYPGDDFIEQNTNQRNLDPCDKEDAEQTARLRSCHDYEIDVPITPPYVEPKYTINKNCIHLRAEELSPDCTTFHITDADKDMLESLGSQSAVKPLLLKVPLIRDKPEQCTIKELKERTSINSDTSVDLALEDDWGKLGSNMKNARIIEQLKINIPSTENLNPTEIDSFKPIIYNNLERISEEVSPIIQKTSEKQSSCRDSSLSVTNVSSSQINVIFMDPINNADMNTDYMKAIIHGGKNDQPKVVLPLLNNEKFKQYLTPTKEILSDCHVNQASTSQQQSHNSYTSLEGSQSGYNTQAKEHGDLLSSFIALRTKQSLGHGDRKHENNVLYQEKSEPQKSRSKVISDTMHEEFTKQQIITVHVMPSASQCQAYQIIHAAAEPVLNKLVCLEVLACLKWNFTSVTFDCTRFLLRKQERIMSDISKLGNKSDKGVIIFQNAALLHSLVILRDLILMCSLDATLEYLSKAKQEYKSVLGPYLDDMWRKLRIVQFVRDKAEEPNPKITALLKWMERANVERELLKSMRIIYMRKPVGKDTTTCVNSD
ncbi:protein shortage in chiasmata 1 ortholog [Bufo bufo]|uniref:protein shortage in chiasmata 1 ortholog n=1 Tax=Bufo bufo TaxID=8384 RepID=UPI001ABEACEF|nr:protein shortage in chiasmata 1 ortholog [Bufo bufo]